MTDAYIPHYTWLRGTWRPGLVVRMDADLLGAGTGGPMRMGSFVRSTPNGASLTLHHGYPGHYPLYFLRTRSGDVHFHDSKLTLRRLARTFGGKVDFVQPGETVTFSSDLDKPMRAQRPLPDIEPVDGDPQALVAAWWETFVRAVEEMYTLHTRQGGRIGVTASSGTDSLCVVQALREIGADFTCLVSGTGMDAIDPARAVPVFQHMGVKHEFVPVPTENAAVERLTDRVLRNLEHTGESLVLMGLPYVALADRAHELGLTGLMGGKCADYLVGNIISVFGEFNQLPEAGQTWEAWKDIRMKHFHKWVDGDAQLVRHFAQHRLTPFVPFQHPDVVRATMALPFSVCPPKLAHKPLFETVLNPHVPEAIRPWLLSRKIGFYTGAGTGTLRKHLPCLSDPALRDRMGGIRRGFGL